MDYPPFHDWLHMPQPERSPGRQVRAYVHDNPELQPTRQEVASLLNSLYRRLRRGDEYPMIDYNPTGPRAEADAPPIVYSESTALTNVSGAITRNGFALAATTEALQDVASSHRNASAKQQTTVSRLVTSFEGEIAAQRTLLSNEERLHQLDQQRANDLAASLEEARRDKAFLQDMLRGNRRGGNSPV